MKLTFEPVTNKIGDNYYIVPKNDTEGVKVVIKCDEVGKFIINMLTENHNQDEMIAAMTEQYPDATAEEIEATVVEARRILYSTVTAKPKTE